MWTPKYENGCLIMLKYALEPLHAPEPLCDCLHQVVTRTAVSERGSQACLKMRKQLVMFGVGSKT